MIPFSLPTKTGNELDQIRIAIENGKLAGNGFFTKKCEEFFEIESRSRRSLLTPSCTAAIEMAAILLDIKPGDEVIMPSFTFVSTANAFVLRGAKIRFIDIRPETMNLDERLLEAAITKNTKCVVPVHYAGVSCEMREILQIASNAKISVIEDAAQGIGATYFEQSLGAIGQMGALSFHETKNITSGGEGGLLMLNDEQFIERSEIIREKGTNRSLFFRGMIDKYTWCDLGSSFLASELQSAYLLPQLQNMKTLTESRLASWIRYQNNLKALSNEGKIELPVLPSYCNHNGHIFWVKVANLEERTALMSFLQDKKVTSAFHYIPLHSSPAGRKFGEFVGVDRFTTIESDRLLRLPIFHGISAEQIDSVCEIVTDFFRVNRI